MPNDFDTSAFPLGSTDPRVLYNNAGNEDLAVNDVSNEYWIDRPPFNRRRKTLYGMEAQFNRLIEAFGFTSAGPYAAGLVITSHRQYIEVDGQAYVLKAETAVPYTVTGNWATESVNFKLAGDSVLRQELAAPTGSTLVGDGSSTVGAKLASIYPFRNLTPEQFGDVGDGVTTTANAAINAALVFAKTNGGFVNLTPGKTYLIDGNANPIPTTITGDRNGGVLLQSGVTLNVNNAVLKCKVSTQNGYSILNYTNTVGAIVRGPGRVWGDVVDHGATGGEYGYGAFATQCTGGRLIGLTIDRCWGDAVFAGEGTPGDASTAPIDFKIIDCVFDYNRRQGLSCVGASDVAAYGTVFKRTGRIKGIAPSAGVDLETDNVPGQVNRRIKFYDCDIYDNAGVGFATSGQPLSSQEIELHSCRISGNDNGALRTEHATGQAVGSCASLKMFGGKLDGGITGGQNVELYGVDVLKSQGNLSAFTLLLEEDAGFRMFGGSVTSIGATQQLYYSAGTTKESAKNIMTGVDFTLQNGPTGICFNVNGINVFDNCNFYVGGTTPSGNFGFDVLKFDGKTAQIDNCYFDPAYHSASTGNQFKGRFSTNRMRGGTALQPYYGAGVAGQIELNNTPVPTGSPQYVVWGWMCTTTGNPGVWVPLRALTGS